jgi:hypothetical protein
MATTKHHPDTVRDFKTGTVNPGPGMAPPHDADDIPAGSMNGANGSGQQAKAGQKAAPQDQKDTTGGTCGSCGCG